MGGVSTPEQVAEQLALSADEWERNGFGYWMFFDAATGEPCGARRDSDARRVASTAAAGGRGAAGEAVASERWGDGAVQDVRRARLYRGSVATRWPWPGSPSARPDVVRLHAAPGNVRARRVTVEKLAGHEPTARSRPEPSRAMHWWPSASSGARASPARGGCAGWRPRRTRAAAAPARRCSTRSCATPPARARRASGATPGRARSRCTSEQGSMSCQTCSSHPTSDPTCGWSAAPSRASAPTCSSGSPASSATTRRPTSPPRATSTRTRCAAASRRCSTSWR